MAPSPGERVRDQAPHQKIETGQIRAGPAVAATNRRLKVLVPGDW